MPKDLVNKGGNKIVENGESPEGIQVISLDLTQMEAPRVKGILAEILQGLHVVENIKNVLVENERYILNIPKEIEKGIKAGECWLTKKAGTGELLASVSHKVDGRDEFMKNLTATKETFDDKKTFENISSGILQMAIHQQLIAMAAELQEVSSSIKQIEAGQADDRFAKIDGARWQLILASKMDNRQNQIDTIKGAMPLLAEGTESVEKALSRKIGEFDEVPSNKIGIYIKMFLCNGDYKKRKDQEVDYINEYFKFLMTAHELMACASIVIGEPNALPSVFEHLEKFFKSVDTKKVESISHMHPELDLSKEWYSDPTGFIEAKKTEYLKLSNHRYDFISAEFSGQQLLEAFKDDKTGQTEEQG
ncbi:MAG: hypothetical protein GXY17_03640 [Clostridiaceae bacterium]|nr:hypothetical protein [Clostridiaceae bacterium]